MKMLDIPSAVQILKKGGIIAYPTETFYGLGCDATNFAAIQKIFELKGRDEKNPLPVLIDSVEKLPLYVREIPLFAEKLIQKFWPGPLTLVFWAKEGCFPEELLAGTQKIALRISSHPLAQKLTKGFGLPLTTTSANRAGEIPARSAEELKKYFSNIDGVVEGGELLPSKGSTILDVTCKSPKVLREGDILKIELQKYTPSPLQGEG